MNADHQPHPRNGATPAPGKGDEAAKGNTNSIDPRPAPQALALLQSKDEPRIDSMTLADQLHQRHDSLFKLVKIHQADFDSLGKVGFQIRASEVSRTGQAVRVALLTEDQAYLLLTYSRNTAKVRRLKIKMVQAFSAARRAADMRQVEYLPEYHRLHDAIKVAAAGSPNERWMHVNANKALNKIAGLAPGQRAAAGPLHQSLLTLGAALATKAILEGKDGQAVQQRIDTALKPLAGVLALGEAR